jgi:Tetratricopeptide repeat
MTSLALNYRDLGDVQGARDLLEQALAGRQRVLGHDHPSTLRTMSSSPESANDSETSRIPAPYLSKPLSPAARSSAMITPTPCTR